MQLENDKEEKRKKEIFNQYVTYYKTIRQQELYQSPKVFNDFIKLNPIAESLIVKSLSENKEDNVIIQKGYHTTLTEGLDKVSKASKNIALHPYVLLSSIGGVIATAMTSNPSFAIMGISALTSLGVLSVVAGKINEKLVEDNIERIATHIAEEKVSDIKNNTYKNKILDNIEGLRGSSNSIKKYKNKCS